MLLQKIHDKITGWIAGVAFGQSSLQDYDIGTQLTTSDDSDDSDDSMRIFGGYMLDRKSVV